MNPQQQEFEKALANLTPDERVNFTRSNPSVVVGDSRMNVTQSGVYEPIPKTINVGDIKTNEQLIPVPTVKPTTNIVSPYISQPQNTTLQNGLATPVITPPAPQAEKSLYQKTLESLGVDISALDKKGEVTKQLQEEQKLAEKTQRATEAYNTYTQKKRQYEQEIQKMQETNPEGQFGGSRNVAIQDFQRKANADLANLAVEAQMSQGLVDSARQTIKDSIEAQFQPIQDRIDIRTKYAQLASNDLTESEKYQLQQLSQKETKEKDDLTKTFNDLASAVLDNGNPPGVLSSMNKVVDDYLNKRITGDEARAKLFSTAGRYGGDIVGQAYKKAQIDKLLADTPVAGDRNVVESPFVNAIVNVTAGSAEGQQKRDAQRVAQFVQNGQTNQAKQFILSRVTSKMSAGERDAQLDRRNTIDALLEMKSALNDYVQVTGDTNILTGGIENLANKIGQTSDPKLSAIKTKVIQATQKYRNAITGAAWGEQETREYKSLFPSISNTSKLNNTIIDTMIPALKNNERNAIGIFLGGSDVYDSIFSDPLGLGAGQSSSNNPLGI